MIKILTLTFINIFFISNVFALNLFKMNFELNKDLFISLKENNFEQYYEKIFIYPYKYDKMLNDNKKRRSPDFEIPDYFFKNSRLWFHIYSNYRTNSILVHDKFNLDIVYNAFNFSKLEKTNFTPFEKAHLRSYLGEHLVFQIKKSLVQKKGYQYNYYKKRVLKSNSLNKISNDDIEKLTSQMRIQTGQRDKIKKGIERSLPYQPFIKKYLSYFKLPKEFLTKPFIESTFNLKAISKVGAVGLWQFMPFIGKAFMKINRREDHRLNPFISSIAAMFLLRQNYQILGRWDLSITAYNSGTKHLIKARRQLKKKKPSLEEIFKNYKSEHHGFASKNYYASFLALSQVLNYEDLIFDDLDKSNLKLFKHDKIEIYVSKCRFKPRNFFRKYKKYSKNIKLLNPHIKKERYMFPKGTILIADINLNSREFYKLSDSQIKKRYPKNWFRYVRNQKCSKR